MVINGSLPFESHDKKIKLLANPKKHWIVINLEWLIINVAPVELFYDKQRDSLKEMACDTLS